MKISNVLVSDSWGEITPDALERGIGGREGAMVYLSREWARAGHEVTNFVNVEKGVRFDEKRDWDAINPLTGKTLERGQGTGITEIRIDNRAQGYHEYMPLNLTTSILTNFPYDVVIAWECPSLFRNDIKTGLKICEMQVAHFLRSEKEWAAKCDYVAALSQWHKEFLLHSGLEMEEDKVLVFPNGVDISRYPKEEVAAKFNQEIGEDPYFVYSSSPDRGLWQLLQAWPYIREAFPGATLDVAYGTKKWTEQLKWSHIRQAQQAIDIEYGMNLPGVNDLGKIGQGELSGRQIDADAWLYPLDSIQATETGCITAVENAAAGNPILTTDCDCMEAEFGPVGAIYNLPFNAEEYASGVEQILKDPKEVHILRRSGRNFAESRDWKVISKKWLRLFENHARS